MMVTAPRTLDAASGSGQEELRVGRNCSHSDRGLGLSCAHTAPSLGALQRRYTVRAMRAVTIEIPESLLVGSGQSTEEFAKEAKLLLLAKLFELGRVSSGKAAEACGMSRVEFLLAAGKLGVSPVQLDPDELARELGDA